MSNFDAVIQFTMACEHGRKNSSISPFKGNEKSSNRTIYNSTAVSSLHRQHLSDACCVPASEHRTDEVDIANASSETLKVPDADPRTLFCDGCKENFPSHPTATSFTSPYEPSLSPFPQDTPVEQPDLLDFTTSSLLPSDSPLDEEPSQPTIDWPQLEDWPRSSAPHAESVSRGKRRDADFSLAELPFVRDAFSIFDMLSKESSEDEQHLLSPPPLAYSPDATSEPSPIDPPTPSDNLDGAPLIASWASLRHSSACCEHNAPVVEPLKLSVPSRTESDEGVDAAASEDALPIVKFEPPELQIDVREPLPAVSSTSKRGKKRKRLDDSSDLAFSHPTASLSETHRSSPFWFPVRGSARKNRKLRITHALVDLDKIDLLTEMLGDRGRCQFSTFENGVEKLCNQELVDDPGLLTLHLSIHLHELGYHSDKEECYQAALAAGLSKEEARKADFMAYCPWCKETPTKFGGLMRHIIYTELKVNAEPCECGGTNSRSNQKHNIDRHEQSAIHQAYLKRKAQEDLVKDEKDDAGIVKEEFVEGSSRGRKRRRRSE